MRKLLMPQAGKSPGPVTLKRWLRAVGESVASGGVLAQAESAEGPMELEVADGGTLEAILLPAGQSAMPGTPIAEIREVDAEQPKQTVKPMAEAKPTGGNVTPIVMPQAGNSMEEGTIVKWLVKEGDRITKGQVIFEIETDKANMEVEATEDGRLAKIVAKEGDVVPVKQPVAFLAEGEVDLGQVQGAAAPAVEESRKQKVESRNEEPLQAAPAAAVNAVPGDVKASPAARRMAQEAGLDLASVGAGSGPGGRILSTDLSRAAKVGSASVVAAPAVPPVATPAKAPAVPAAPLPEGGVRKKMSKMRKAIAANLLASKQNIPHFYLRCTINADAMMAFYRGEKAKYPCSVNDVVTLATARAIMEFPAFRSKIDGDEIVEYGAANVGVAVGVEDGLTVPVLLGANAMNLQQIAANTKRIVENARGGKLEGWGEGNFTITNLGMFGVEEFAAIVNPPEPGILAVGAVREAVIVKDGAMKAGRVMTMTLSCDHRVIDGLLAAKFMARMKELLETPSLLA